MTNEAWVEGWTMLTVAFAGQPIAPEIAAARGRVYRDKLDYLNDREWIDGVSRALDSCDFFPTIKALREYAQPVKSEPVVRATNMTKAQEAYEDIVGSYECGHPANQRDIRERYGAAGGEAFMAAGGHHAFAYCEPRNEPFRRKAFVETFEKVATADPEAKLPALPAPSITEVFALPQAKVLPLDQVTSPGLGLKRLPRPEDIPHIEQKRVRQPETTREMLDRIRRAEALAKPIADSDERRAELARQAELIKGE